MKKQIKSLNKVDFLDRIQFNKMKIKLNLQRKMFYLDCLHRNKINLTDQQYLFLNNKTTIKALILLENNLFLVHHQKQRIVLINHLVHFSSKAQGNRPSLSRLLLLKQILKTNKNHLLLKVLKRNKNNNKAYLVSHSLYQEVACFNLKDNNLRMIKKMIRDNLVSQLL